MRTREYRRQKRKVKIKQRKEMAVAIGGHGEPGGFILGNTLKS